MHACIHTYLHFRSVARPLQGLADYHAAGVAAAHRAVYFGYGDGVLGDTVMRMYVCMYVFLRVCKYVYRYVC